MYHMLYITSYLSSDREILRVLFFALVGMIFRVFRDFETIIGEGVELDRIGSE